MIKTTLPLVLCLGLASAFSASASDDQKEFRQRIKYLEGQQELARGELDAIKKHQLYEQILKDIIAQQVNQDEDDVRSTKVQSLESMSRDVLYLIFARSGNFHAIRETSSVLKNKLDAIKSIYGLPCIHDKEQGGDAPSAHTLNFAESPALEAAIQARRTIYLSEIRAVQQERQRQANELKARMLHQAKLDAAHRDRINREVAENEIQSRKIAEEKARNERITARKAREAELSRMAAEEKQRQMADKTSREEEKARARAEQERLEREEQVRIQAEQARIAQEEQSRLEREARERAEAADAYRWAEQRRQEAERARRQQEAAAEVQAPRQHRAAANRL